MRRSFAIRCFAALLPLTIHAGFETERVERFRRGVERVVRPLRAFLAEPAEAAERFRFFPARLGLKPARESDTRCASVASPRLMNPFIGLPTLTSHGYLVMLPGSGAICCDAVPF